VATGLNVRAPRLAAIAVVFPVDAATAHVAFEGGGGFFGGAIHPLFVPAHALAIVALGLLIGQQCPRSPWPASGAYCAGLAAGFAAIVSTVALEWAGDAVLATAGVSGALIALARPIPVFLASALALVTGLVIALDSPPHAISLWDANLILLGTFCGAVVLLLAIVAAASALHRDWQRLGARIVGSWLAAIAIMALALRLTR
jgi:hydrogenase/urease accessory protein HupE